MVANEQQELATKRRCEDFVKGVFGLSMAVAWLVVITGQTVAGGESAALRGLELRVPVEGRFLGLNGSDPVSLILPVRNTSDRERKAVVSAKLLLPMGREVVARSDVMVRAGQTHRLELSLPERPPYAIVTAYSRSSNKDPLDHAIHVRSIASKVHNQTVSSLPGTAICRQNSLTRLFRP